MLPFLTAYDPLGASSGSIDPLGALQTYGELADLLLPGVTTVTSRSRYLSMLCAALAAAEKYRKLLPGASGLAQRRKAVEPFERLWALACVAARKAGGAGAADGLRGITYAEKIYRHLSAKPGKVNCDFKLLKFQSRTGAVGTYWTMLAGGQLVDADTGLLTDEGRELAEHFPEPPVATKDRERFADPEIAHRVSLSLEDLEKWSEKCHLQAADRKERQRLGEALTADDRRECIKNALEIMAGKKPPVWATQALARLSKILSTLPRAVELGLPVVIDAIVVTEQFHESVLVVFETLLWWGTVNAARPLADLISGGDFRKAAARCQEAATNLRVFRERCERPDIGNAVAGLTECCAKVDSCRSERELVGTLLDHHHRVQSGKIDGGMPKRDWITYDSTRLLRPTPRFQRNARPSPAMGLSLTHPYRLEQFAYMLHENSVISRDA